jgi:ABC-2 type transport system permease protein
MTATVHGELRRLRTTRSTWVLLGVALVLTLATAALMLGGVGFVDMPPRGSTELRDAVLGAVGPALFPLLVLGVLAVTGEYHHRTATSTFLVTPDRRKVIAAKAASSAVVAAVATVVMLAVAFGAGIFTDAFAATMDGDLARVVVRTLLASMLWAMLGVGIGSVVHNQTIAVVVPLLWFLVVEMLLRAYGLIWLQPWLPGGATSAISGARFPGSLPVWAAFLVLLGYAVALILAGTHATVRSDVT